MIREVYEAINYVSAPDLNGFGVDLFACHFLPFFFLNIYNGMVLDINMNNTGGYSTATIVDEDFVGFEDNLPS